MVYSKKTKKKTEGYLKDIKSGMAPMVDGKKTPPKKKKK
jgi:hypothetical protein